MKKRHEIERFFDSFETLMNRMGTETHYQGYPRKEDMDRFQEEKPKFEKVIDRDWKASEADLEERSKGLRSKMQRLLSELGKS